MRSKRSLHSYWRIARAGFGFAYGMRSYPAAWFGWFRRRDPLAAAVADLLLIGFYGASSKSPSARLLARQVRRGQVGSVFFVTQNVDRLEDVTGLVAMFQKGGGMPLIAIDHEGGVVQRLNQTHGFTLVPAARAIAASKSASEARIIYEHAGHELAATGFNINLGPVLDIDEPNKPGVGVGHRAYHTDPESIAEYGQAFVEGFGRAGILCAAKHFPGHGRAVSDSHFNTPDISATWTEEELEPFARLFSSPHSPHLVMVGHLRLDTVAPDRRPATVSAPIVTGMLRQRLGFNGVIVTDDIDMGAISQIMSRSEAFVQAIAAGNDLIMIKNLFDYDPLLPQRAVGWVCRAIAQGTLSEAQVMAAADRVRAIRRQAYQKASFEK